MQFIVHDMVCQQNHHSPTVKQKGGVVMVWACFATTGHGHFAIIVATLSFSVQKGIL